MRATLPVELLLLVQHAVVAFVAPLTQHALSGNCCHRKSTSGFKLPSSSDVKELESSSNTASPFVWEKQWYPCFPLSHLEGIGNKPVPFKLLGRNLVLFQTDPGSFSVLLDECPHRRAPLSTGKVVDCSLMCRFHGWQFNRNGACVNIPMFPGSDTQQEKILSKDAFSVPSYPTRQAGGLLWVYLGRDNSPPDFPSDAIIPDDIAQKAEWMVQTFPVSYISMVENSVDPTHAPYTHEGIRDFSGGIFSPEGATPMMRYELVGNSTVSGFTVEHSPYQKQFNATVQRRFIPPCLQKTSMQAFDIYLYFVPTELRQTTVISLFPIPSIKWMERFPNRLLRAVLDTVHYKYYTNPGTNRFFLQDSLTMIGQDTRKLYSMGGDMNKVVLDMAPTPSDAGIKTFQRWLLKFGHGGPFSDPAAVIDSLAEPRHFTLWENHGKNCPRCQRTLARAKLVRKVMRRIKNVSLFGSVVGAFIETIRGRKMILPLAGIIVSLIANYFELLADGVDTRFHRPTNIPDVAVSDVYAY